MGLFKARVVLLIFTSGVNYGFLSFCFERRDCRGQGLWWCPAICCGFFISVWSPKGDTLDVLDVGPVVEDVALYLTLTCVLALCHNL